jgi:ribosomal protein L37E
MSSDLCRGWTAITPCGRCHSTHVKGSPPRCSGCGIFRPIDEVERCSAVVSLWFDSQRGRCAFCSYPQRARKVLVHSSSEAYASDE